MTRVLHLLDQSGPAGETLALRLSRDSASFTSPHEQHAWLLLGGEPMRDAAIDAGLDRHRTRLMPRPVGFTRLVPGASRRLRALLGQADRVECWTVGAATLASRLGCSHVLPRFGQATLCDYARQVIGETALNSPPLREGPGEGGETPRTPAQHRAALRDHWHADEQSLIVALLADHPERVDAREALMAMAFSFETLSAAQAERGDIRLLCHPLARRRSDAQVLAELLGQPQLVVQDASVLAPWQVLPACDLALAPDPSHAGLSILWASAMGVPVIAPRDPMLPMLAELENVMRAKTGDAKHLADPMTRWATSHQPCAQPC